MASVSNCHHEPVRASAGTRFPCVILFNKHIETDRCARAPGRSSEIKWETELSPRNTGQKPEEQSGKMGSQPGSYGE